MSSATYKEAAAPPTPPSGYVVFYAKADSLLYMKNDAGVEVPIKPIGGGTGDLLSDGSVPMVADWDLGAFVLRALQFHSDIADGTAPFIVVSSTEVANLRAQFASLAYATFIDIRNESGSIITKGTPVYVSGYNAGLEIVLVNLADASVAATMPCIGLASADIANNATGRAIASGHITSVDTSAFSVGDDLHISETAGELTAAEPQGTALIQSIGRVLRAHASSGVIGIAGANRVNQVPNLPEDEFWMGDSNGVAQETEAAAVRTALNVEDGATADLTGYVGQNLQTGTTYELVLTDAGKMVDLDNASAIALTIPANSAVPFPVNTRIDLNQGGAGLLTAGITTDTLYGDPVSVGQNKSLSLWKKSATVWVIYGGTTA